MSKPKSSDYKESEVDKVNAAVAMADKKYFRENYLPKQKEFLERSFKQESGLMSMGEGRAQADTMQALTQNPNRRAVGAVDAQADLASAASAQQLQGTAQGLVGARSDQVAGIKSANQMASQTAAGLSQASKIATTDTLNRAKAKQTRNSALIGAATKLGVQAGKNYSQYRAAESLNTQESNKPENEQNLIPMTENAGLFKIVTGRGLG
tara:strand:- start:507 stop:1133 length:627 start_codon:yes stop_codon:yes gene_type:complete